MDAPLVITLSEIRALLGVGTTTLWQIRTSDQSFPKPLELAGRKSKLHRYDRKAFFAWYEQWVQASK